MDGQHVVFRLGGQDFAAEIAVVTEIITPKEVTRLPQAPDCVEGVIRLREHIIPVIDLRRRLGLPAAGPTRESRIVILEVEGRLVGAAVDGVAEVIQVGADELRDPGEVVGAARRYLRGVAGVGDRLVVLMDMRRLVRDLMPAAAQS